MRYGIDILNLISAGKTEELLNGLTDESYQIVKNKFAEIPDSYFVPKYSDDVIHKGKISLIEFARRTSGMDSSTRNGYMREYGIPLEEFSRLQSVINSIQVASEYGKDEKESKDNKGYGISLSDSQTLDKAYPLWIAYLYADSKNPMLEVRDRLIADGKDGKYTPEYIVGLIERNNAMMSGRTDNEKKDLYMYTISELLNNHKEISNEKEKDEIEV